MSYQDYLNSEHWRYVKQLARERADDKCQLCGARGVELHVHHNTYENKGKEKLSDVILLCESCHASFHGRRSSMTCSLCGKRSRPFYHGKNSGLCIECAEKALVAFSKKHGDQRHDVREKVPVFSEASEYIRVFGYLP